jgi:hypothetical protein
MIFNKKQLALGLITTLAAGTALADHQTISSSDGFSYHFDPSESELQGINKTGFTNPIQSSTVLAIDGANFNGSGSTGTGQERDSGTQTLSGLTVSRKTYISSTDNFMRQLSYLQNSTGSAIVVSVKWDLIFSNTETYTIAADNNSVATTFVAGRLSTAMVYGTAGASETADVIASTANDMSVQWDNVSIAAGDTAIFLNYVRGAADPAESLDLVGNLSSDALTGISAGDLSKIVNFDVTDGDTNGIPDSFVGFADTDGDGIGDIIEDTLGTDKNADDRTIDSDGDGLFNADEYLTHKTDIFKADTDGDGLDDGVEINTFKTDPTKADTDSDGLTDKQEAGTFNYNPLDASDGVIHPVTSITDESLEQHQPQVATDSLGRHHITWVEYGNSGGDIRYKLLDANFNTLIDTTNITTDSSENQGHPSIVVDNNNIAYMFWFDSNDTDDGHAYALDPSKHALDGTAATLATVKGFTDAAADPDGIIDSITDMKRTAPAVDSAGRIHVAYQGENDNVGYIVFNNTGAITTAAFQPFNVTIDDDYATGQLRMALDGDNNAHIVWSDDDEDEVHYGMTNGVAGTTLINATALTAGTNSEQHISVSVDSTGKAYIVWGDNSAGDQAPSSNSGNPVSTILFGSLDPSLDDKNGDAAVLATVGFSPQAIAVTDTNPWYMHSNMTADNQITISYNTGGGEGLSPLSYLQIDSTGAITKAVQEIMSAGPKNYSSYSNFAYIAGQIMVYAKDEYPKNIALLDLGFDYAPQYATTNDPQADLITAVKNALNFKGGSSALGLWSLALLLIPMGLRRALKRS